MGTQPSDFGIQRSMDDASSYRPPVFKAMTVHQCLEHLGEHQIGRVAFQVDGQVEVFPVNYVCDGHVVVFRTGLGTRLQRSPRFPVTFETDSWDPNTGLGWSVMLKGVAREVTNGTDRFSKGLRQHNLVPLAPGNRELWIAIFPSEVTGRTFDVHTESRR